MFRFITQKIKNQIWLSLCLLLGMSLLVAVFSCQAMYQKGSLDKLLQTYFADHLESAQEYPAYIGRSGTVSKSEFTSIEGVSEQLDTIFADWKRELKGISFISSQRNFYLYDDKGTAYYAKDALYYKIAYMPDITDHVEIVKGEGYTADDPYGCIISEKVMDDQKLTVGESITFHELIGKDGEPLTLTVRGVYRILDEKDPFWCLPPYDYNNELYFSKEGLESIIRDYPVNKVYFEERSFLDYPAIDSTKVSNLRSFLNRQWEEDTSFVCNFQYIMDQYRVQRESLMLMFFVLSLPMLGMVLAFIYMVSAQVTLGEQAEIATLKSRGIHRRQVLYLYFLRACLMAAAALICGLALGVGMCKLVASTTEFCTFTGTDTGYYQPYLGMALYGLCAVALGILFMMLPVIKHSKVSIVEVKSSYNYGKKMFWEKIFLDVILLAVSLYLAYTYRKSIDQIRELASSGSSADPLIFLSVCLFILSAGMVAFRLMHLFVSGVYKLGRKRWKTVAYTAFLQITRTYRKQMFITIFMILTIAMGLFNANAARTVGRNKEVRIRYTMGADVNFKEKWEGMPYEDKGGHRRTIYFEADYGKYEKMLQEGLVENYTRVLRKDRISAIAREVNTCESILFGIDTDAFGRTAYLPDEIDGDVHWFHSLNALAADPKGVIISENLASSLRLDVGSVLCIEEYSSTVSRESKRVYANVVAVVDKWPGYNVVDHGKEKYLCVVNLPTYMSSIEVYPYEIWANLKEGVTPEDLREYLVSENITLRSFDKLEDKLLEMKESLMVQITNGLFSLSLLVSLLLCGIGFLIYWVSSIHQRELLFGVYRAMGISVRQINRMLILEHIFSTLQAVLAGGIVGMAATFLYVRLFAAVYLPEVSNVPLLVTYETEDIKTVFAVVFAVILVCLLILRRQVKKLNIAQALKLGED